MLNFKRLELEDREIIERFTAKFPPFSDFSFLSLFTYDTNQTIEYCFYKNNLIVRFEDYLSDDSFYSLLGVNDILKTMRLLFKNASSTNIKLSLELVPETTIQAASNASKYFKIKEDRNNFDYIVSTKDIAELSHDKFPRKHKLVERFKENYPNHVVRMIDLKEVKNKQNILDTFEMWRNINHKNEEDTATEYIAIKRLVDNSSHFSNLRVLGIYDKEQLIAFNTFETSKNGCGISSFQKANKQYEGIYAFLTHSLAKKLLELGCDQINFEQDLGIEGLRSSKNSWHPTNFLKKYTVNLRD